MDLDFIQRYLPLLLTATATTLALLACSTLGGTALGILGALLSRSSSTFMRRAALGYSWIFRGSPPLIVLLICYFGLGQMGLGLTPFQAAVLGLSLVGSAYFMEIFRAAVAAVPQGQSEAGLSLGMSRFRVARRIIFPQAFPIAVPAYFSLVVSNLKDTALASAIAVTELVGMSKLVIASTLRPIEIFTVVAVIFVCLGTLIIRCQTWAEKALNHRR